MVIIAANGMCTGGRILHHLRHNLPDPNAQVVIVGYQGETSLGRRLINGAPFVSIFGQDVKVRAQDAHAGRFFGACRAVGPGELGRGISSRRSRECF